ncbi:MULTISPECIES: hypothetical protein [unclassified Streptomyces]|uniref:hypothetical protein n=1 Tax=unclassified Streptomyces TaxID=2593676 RepID=UPI002DD88AE6|nr:MULTISPECIES: hypothetical protein [unclassified Streptomyces]WSB76910.1 hypothetical protein OHB04_14770 [Streptomyces sp. NBC_01775]WSS14817.1 hypothetical protein OG533_25175 [Streptomyces sp. NBC_01186]WSS43651.1 hypothetical protein OG220_25940 [Streptomyces sp. NBC_01187]
MSRETDSSSSGPKRRGGSPYPSGTDPYGTSGAGADPAGQGAEPEAGAKADEPRTETTLTTRIRINIPGSRPIPPVVMRTPVGDDDGAAASDGANAGPRKTSGPKSAGAGPGEVPGAGAPSPAEEARTRAGGPAVPPPMGPGGVPQAPGPAGASGVAPAAATASGSGSGESPEDPSRTGEFTQETSDWFAPRKSPKSGSGASSGATPPPAPSGGASGTGGSGNERGDLPYFTEPRPAEPRPRSGIDEVDERRRPDAESGPGSTGEMPFPGAGGPTDTPAEGLPLLDPSVGLGGGPAGGAPSGPTTGPASGDMPVPPVPGAPGVPGGAPGPLGTPAPAPGQDPAAGPAAGPGGTPPAGTPVVPGAPGGGPPAAHSTLGLGTGPAPFAPDGVGTAIYGTGDPAGPGAPGAGGGEQRLASETVVSGVPHPTPEPAPAAPKSGKGKQAKAGKAKKKGGRSKLVLAGVAVVGVCGVAYGTGLLLDHADVPKNTTVLGVEIGGLSKHEAVKKMDDSLGKRTTEPFKVVAAGKQAELKPSVAGLTFDTEATVRNAAGRDYNPVSVIGSLFDVRRTAEPAVKVDKAKMESALSRVAAGAGGRGSSPSDGMVKFVNGRAVAVKGKPHKGVDTAKSSSTLEKAYKRRAVSGSNKPVTLPVTLQQPKIGDAELKTAVNGFGRTAMSGWVWLEAGDVKVPFSQKTMGKFLTMRAGGGSLQPVIDPVALKATYGSAFDGVVVDGGAGKVRMTPQHAASAMIQALRKKAPPKPGERVAKVPGSHSG